MRQPWAASAARPPDIAEISPGVAALDVAPADPTGPRFRIEDIYPSIDGGRYPAKRIAGDPVDIWADIFREGHDVLAAALLWRREDHPDWQRVPMQFVGNDRWHARFTPQQPGYHLLTVEAWSDQFATWRKEIQLKRKAGLPTTLELDEGITLARQLAGQDPHVLQAIRTAQQDGDASALLDDALTDTLRTPAQRPDLTRGSFR